MKLRKTTSKENPILEPWFENRRESMLPYARERFRRCTVLRANRKSTMRGEEAEKWRVAEQWT